jgi:hypothetical protein
VATSSTEAEYVACSDAAKEALWIWRLLAEIQNAPIPKPIFIESFDHHDIDIQDQLENYGLITTFKSTNHGPTSHFCRQAIKLSKNPQFHNRTKHIDIKYHFIRDSYQK